MSEPFLLFVYGQLMSGGIGHRQLNLRMKTRSLGKARVKGRLHDLGDYPGLVTGQHGIVHGELLAFEQSTLWSALDAYEHYDPGRVKSSEYRRIEINLLNENKQAWVYIYNRPMKDKPIITAGLWMERRKA